MKVVEELGVARVAPDEVTCVGLEEVFKREDALGFGEIGGRFGDNIVESVFGGAAGVIADLLQQRRDKIEGLLYAGELVEQLHHAVVILQGMHADPREAVFAGGEVLIERLMHVPQKAESQYGHTASILSGEKIFCGMGGGRCAR